MTVCIIDYGSGNLRSAAKAFERAAREVGYGGAISVTADADAVAKAERVVLPGVGAFADCRRGLDAVPGMVEALRAAVVGRGRPFLGICVGMQLMAERGFEHGACDGLGWIKGDVVALAANPGPDGAPVRIPHMGWNELRVVRPHPLLKGLPPGGNAYFVHSYHMACRDPGDVIATVDYGQTVAAVVGRDNLAGTQFHPEKSQSVGLALIANFLSWRPA
ncbi:MAG: imidazole glycerol phosphate synthase subunit HisH [Rhodospirillaceae bacterium]|nr:imidazole glycerol phosphate synthase subunit HisH [Rhodospirillaceae bacterium]